MSEEKRSCENCGNARCENSLVAIHCDECVQSAFAKHWKPKRADKPSSESGFVCLLGIDPAKSEKCKPSECRCCGWNKEEADRRRAYVAEHGLTLCADGLRRLIIRKENEAMKYTVCASCGAHLDNGEKCDCTIGRDGNKELDDIKNEKGAIDNDRD